MSRSRITIAIVLLVIAVTGIVVWFVRTPKPKPPEPVEKVDKLANPVDMKTLLGTLSVRAVTKEAEDASRYWLYIEGRIVAKKEAPQSTSSPPIDILLVPGEYNVEVGVTHGKLTNSDYSFPLAFRGQKIRIDAGKITRIQLSVKAESSSLPTMVSPLAEPSWDWFNAWVKKVDEQLKLFQKDPVHLAVLECFKALQQYPPVHPAVYIKLPPENGGGREFDADQVKLIVAWLKRYRSDTLSPLPADFVAKMPDEMRAKYDQVLTVITNYQTYIDQFNAIPKNLEEAKGL